MTENTNTTKRGRRPKYQDYYPHIVKWMCRSGATDEEIAAELDIGTATLYRWRNKYPEFRESLKEGKKIADAIVEDGLYRRAVGFEYEETKIIYIQKQDGAEISRRIEKTKKHALPDVTACIFWLKNRDSQNWRDIKSQDISEGDGKSSKDYNVVVYLPDRGRGDSPHKPRHLTDEDRERIDAHFAQYGIPPSMKN